MSTPSGVVFVRVPMGVPMCSVRPWWQGDHVVRPSPVGWSRGTFLVVRGASQFGSPPRRGVSVCFRLAPPSGGFPYGCCGPLLIIRSGRIWCAPFMGQPISCAPLRDVLSAPLYGAAFCASLYGASLSVPLYGAAAAPLYGTSFRRPFMGLPVGAPLYGASFRCPFMGRPLIMWVCVPYLFARVLRLACRRFPGFCEPIGCSRHTKLVCCT